MNSAILVSYPPNYGGIRLCILHYNAPDHHGYAAMSGTESSVTVPLLQRNPDNQVHQTKVYFRRQLPVSEIMNIKFTG